MPIIDTSGGNDTSLATQQGAPDISGTDWTFEHIRTLITWLNYSNVNLFLIDMSIRYFKSILSHVMAYTLLFSTISSTISISQLGISVDNSPTLYYGIQYTFIAASTLSTLLIGYVKLFKVQEALDMNSVLYKQWLTFSTRISSEFQMPVHMRTSALELLQNMKNEYIDLFCKNATIPFPVQRSANLYFQKNLATTAVRPGCWSRPNYVKRTNIFFIFQDIIKNEIKRLSAELTPIMFNGHLGEYDNMVPSYYSSGAGGGEGANASPHTPILPGMTRQNTAGTGAPHYIGPQAVIEYKYDGPFIVIDVKDRSESAAFIRQNLRHKKSEAAASAAAAPVATNTSPTGETSRKRSTLMSHFKRQPSNGQSTLLDVFDIPSRKERQMSFSLPEMTIIQQSCDNQKQQLKDSFAHPNTSSHSSDTNSVTSMHSTHDGEHEHERMRDSGLDNEF